MKCPNCGKEYSWNSSFCEHCGKPVESAVSKSITAFKKTINTGIQICKRKKWILPTVILVVVVLIVGSIILNKQQNIDFTEYVTIEVSGYDGFGNLKATIDYDALAEKVLGKVPDSNSKDEYERYLSYLKNKESLKSMISLEVDKTSQLKNGDFVLVTVAVENDPVFADNKIKVKDEPYTETFEIGKDTNKLLELREINLLEAVSVLFLGLNGDGGAEISREFINIDLNSDENVKETITFSFTSGWGYSYFEVHSSLDNQKYLMIKVLMENTENLSNGDTVKVIIEPNEAVLAEMFGVKITNVEREYTVSGLF